MLYSTMYMGGVLVHHGILGQKHGVRNGPPYPLNENDHSAREKKDGWEKSLGKRGESHHDSIYERYRNKKAKKRFEKNYKKLNKITDKKKANQGTGEATSKAYTKMLNKAKVSDEELKAYKKAKDAYDNALGKYVYHEENSNAKKYEDKLDSARKKFEKEKAKLAKKVIGDYRNVNPKEVANSKYSVKDQLNEIRKGGMAKMMTVDEKYLKKRLKY